MSADLFGIEPAAPPQPALNPRRRAMVRKVDQTPAEKDGFYRTPPTSSEPLLRAEHFSPVIWEPSCGDGMLARVLEAHGHRVIGTDLVDRGYGEGGRDFLLERELLAPSIVMNPPFHLADEFILHSLALGARKVAMFGPLAYLQGIGRKGALWDVHKPARIWVLSKRQTLWRGDDPNPKTSGGAIPYAWFVWEAGQTGCAVGWLL